MGAETDIQTAIMLAASAAGHRLFRNNIGVARYKTKAGKMTAVSYGVGGAGAPDLIGWCRDGVFAAIEVKRPGEEPDQHQVDWHAAARRANPLIRIGWADNVADALEILEGREPRPIGSRKDAAHHAKQSARPARA